MHNEPIDANVNPYIPYDAMNCETPLSISLRHFPPRLLLTALRNYPISRRKKGRTEEREEETRAKKGKRSYPGADFMDQLNKRISITNASSMTSAMRSYSLQTTNWNWHLGKGEKMHCRHAYPFRNECQNERKITVIIISVLEFVEKKFNGILYKYKPER